MEMSLINAGLAAGAALAALPVILHLFMRQTPKHIIFPALRLVRERQKRSKKRLRIKNWLLLLARMAILALMALALARPRVYSEVPLGDESVPMALGLVFDTSLSMEYKDKDKTRLDEAKGGPRRSSTRFPTRSLVFVVDSAEPGVPIGLSPAAALKRIEEPDHPRRQSAARTRPWGRSTRRSPSATAPCTWSTCLTDLARTAWDAGRPAEGLEQVAKAKSGKGSRSPRSCCG